MTEEKTYRATQAKDLLDYLLNPNIPKNEAEHFASGLIAKLQKENATLQAKIAELEEKYSQCCADSGECSEGFYLMKEENATLKKQVQKLEFKLQCIRHNEIYPNEPI